MFLYMGMGQCQTHFKSLLIILRENTNRAINRELDVCSRCAQKSSCNCKTHSRTLLVINIYSLVGKFEGFDDSKNVWWLLPFRLLIPPVMRHF